MKKITNKIDKTEKKKVVLLYSGGLDTSVILKWIQDKYNADIIALTIDVGQAKDDFNAIKKKALKLGAKKAYIIDVKKEFAEKYIAPSIKANGLYQGVYPLSTSLGRPLMSKIAVDIAKKEKTEYIAHGCTGKGNDQVRLEVSAQALNPKIKVIAPVREWNMGRDEEIAYAKKNKIPISVTLKSPYSIDDNMWGKSTEGGVIEEPDKIIPEKDVVKWVNRPEKAPNKPQYIALTFKNGIPVALNKKKMPLDQLIIKLNDYGVKHGIGIIEHIEDRIVGIKIRDFYECPAAMIIIPAHKDLERYVSTIHENSFKEIVEQKWAYLVYAGLWYEPLLQDLNAYINKINEKVDGEVKIKLYKGTAKVVARKSPYALYDKQIATFMADGHFCQEDAVGFIKFWGLQSVLSNQIKNHNSKKKK